jgi:hypothetical protein
MTRAIPGRTFLLLAVLAATATACATTDTELARRAGAPLDEPWHAEISPRFRNIRVAVSAGCVVIFGRTAIDADEPQRLVRCLDPATGTQRWSRIVDVPRGLVRDKLHATPWAMIYQSGDRALGFDADTGATLWSFDPGGRAIHAAFVLGDRLYMSTDRETLVTLDAREGTWVTGHKSDGHTLLGVTRGPRGPLAIVRVEEPGPAILALELDSPGTRTPAPPFKAPREAWRLDPDGVRGFRLVGEQLLAVLPDRIWAVNATNGETIHDAERTGVPAPKPVTPSDMGMRSFPSLETGTRNIALRDLSRSGPELPHQGVYFGPRSLVSHTARTGVLLDMVEIDRWDPGTLVRSWRSTRTSTGRVTAIHEVPELDALVVATPKQVALLDMRTGRLLLERRIDPLRSGWTSIATDGRALYVLYGNDPAPRLEALPLATTAPGK